MRLYLDEFLSLVATHMSLWIICLSRGTYSNNNCPESSRAIGPAIKTGNTVLKMVHDFWVYPVTFSELQVL